MKAVLEALERHRGNKTRAAAELGITRQTLSTWIKNEASGTKQGSVKRINNVVKVFNGRDLS
jgi:DNA-binding NtrC family response regulator